MFGAKARTPLNLAPSKAIPLDEARNRIREAVKENVEWAQRNMKFNYDRSRVSASYKVGDHLLVRNHNQARDQSRKL